jgi:microcystin-dependent protein
MMRFVLMMLMAGFGPSLLAQDGVGIGTTTPHPNAVLDIVSNNKGILIPRTTLLNRDAISNPEAGLIVYITDQNAFSVYNGNQWTMLTGIHPGTVIMWHGINIPQGWALCDGSNGTPDLRGRFVLGYHPGQHPSNNVVGGGSAYVTIGLNEMPQHTHSVSDPGHTHGASISDGNHFHSVSYEDVVTSGTATYGDDGVAVNYGGQPPASLIQTTGLPTYNTTINTASAGVSMGSTGGSLPHENRPPYYVLAFIMKL